MCFRDPKKNIDYFFSQEAFVAERPFSYKCTESHPWREKRERERKEEGREGWGTERGALKYLEKKNRKFERF